MGFLFEQSFSKRLRLAVGMALQGTFPKHFISLSLSLFLLRFSWFSKVTDFEHVKLYNPSLDFLMQLGLDQGNATVGVVGNPSVSRTWNKEHGAVECNLPSFSTTV